ncbi:ADP-ribosylglycohydrolase [Murinocardiopsis flavida]|uniref:ADP-ribosylglycohydrolase n=1 Tax=Murinocardiopsis flavida TaxID=645275 RepID=A0A2P8D570_9ACTN|nr:ADP-ribosylglycohydrolase family protein [Murinocardiopsis flavida]PSK92363.1 ADP-ribosylglycohydrolase [Murinocardiopsis flavida]
MTDDRLDSARGALLGLAVGDAIGMPAHFHRHARSGWSRAMLWQLSADLDAQQVSRPLLPFTPTADGHPLCGTDDTETMATAALVLLGAEDHGSDGLFRRWRHYIAEDPEAWCGTAERSAARNARKGLVPPHTGADNPVHWDDGAVSAAVACGVRYAGDVEQADRVAAAYAGITHAHEGVEAARAMARIIAALVAGSPWEAALDEGAAAVARDGWLGRNLRTAEEIARQASSAFAAVPALARALSPGTYSDARVAPETLPAALAIARLCGPAPEAAIQAASLLSRQSDSLPAMVGAMTGAAAGADALPEEWRTEVDEVRGVLVPGVAGTRLGTLATRLLPT